MPTHRRTRHRVADRSPARDPVLWHGDNLRARAVTAIALALALLLPLQIASATMARLLRPAHIHASLPAVVEARRDGIVVAMAPRPAAPTFDAIVGAAMSFVPEPALQPRPEAASGIAHAHGRGHPHPHAHSHADRPASPRPDHAHGHAHHRSQPHAPPPAAAYRADPLPRTHVHATSLDTEAAAHARAHADGVGHHRHAPDARDVVYLDDDASRLSPAAPPARTADVTVMLLPANPWLPGGHAGNDRPPGLPPASLAAHYGLPGERPPR